MGVEGTFPLPTTSALSTLHWVWVNLPEVSSNMPSIVFQEIQRTKQGKNQTHTEQELLLLLSRQPLVAPSLIQSQASCLSSFWVAGTTSFISSLNPIFPYLHSYVLESNKALNSWPDWMLWEQINSGMARTVKGGGRVTEKLNTTSHQECQCQHRASQL